jgi:hypothetical protein
VLPIANNHGYVSSKLAPGDASRPTYLRVSPRGEPAGACPSEPVRPRCRRPYREHVRFAAVSDQCDSVGRGRIRCCFRSFERQRFQRDLGAKLRAKSHRVQATPGNCQRVLMQLVGPLRDTRQRDAMVRRCLPNSGSRRSNITDPPDRLWARNSKPLVYRWLLGTTRSAMPSPQ